MTTTDRAPRRTAEEIKAVPVRHPGRWIAMVVVLVLVAMLVNAILTNPNFHWDIVFQYLTVHSVLIGLWHTVLLTVICQSIGIVGGVILAVMRLSPNPILSGISWLYIWFFRGTPLLVQILFWGFIGALFKTVGLGIPFGPEFVTFQTQDLITVFAAAVLGLGLNEAAYMAEIARAGILSVNEGQTEAAQSLGMSRLLTMRRVVLPQAMRVIIPPTGNETISMLKNTALVSVIAYGDLLYSVQVIYSRTYQTIPLLISASIWYLVLTSILTIGQFYIERHFGRGSTRNMRDTPLQRLRQLVFRQHDPMALGRQEPPDLLGPGSRQL
ncbi:MAG TPA: amino acid ABC transporter permease [Segeticoccus sp.]|uniref:amino acid ABC transporter permease n=1 Tax=Segeticoccus sp. TaxID=2706531 RepID=UPI002D7EC5FE|nr:amino acid ABC transporter permease [Segeticoccus sp.]HET8601769.1 amino acid ABC transporter permease [Segeticoccus sp.]